MLTGAGWETDIRGESYLIVTALSDLSNMWRTEAHPQLPPGHHIALPRLQHICRGLAAQHQRAEQQNKINTQLIQAGQTMNRSHTY